MPKTNRPTTRFSKAAHPAVLPGLGKITAVLGEGGVAWVYEVLSSKYMVHRAVKVLKEGAGESNRDRFEHEMKIVPNLQHDNIIKVFGVGETAGRPYIEMERFRGVSLEMLLTECGALPHAVVLAIALAVCEALHFAHTHEFMIDGKLCRGILHRDLKPANILVSDKGTVKLTDFGAARPHDSTESPEKTLFGSLQYVAPEDIRGGAVDLRSDVFSLGMVLYEALTGDRAFPQTDTKELVQARLTNQCEALGTNRVAGPRKLRRLVDRCMFMDPGSRFDSVATISAVLLDLADRHLKASPEHHIREFLDDLGRPSKRTARERITGTFTRLLR